jgi:hypothetical protein
MNTPQIKKRTKQKSKAVQLSLTINGVTIIKQNVQPNGQYFGVRYNLPPKFSYNELLAWRAENHEAISNFRKQTI